MQIVRPVHYSLFTFGESELPYYLVLEAKQPGEPVSVRQGEVRITRPLIITPDNSEPEFVNFFSDDDDAEVAQYLLARTASFSHLRLNHTSRGEQLLSDSVAEIVDRLDRQLDDDDEDRVAILTAPAKYANLAILKFATERVIQSTTDNITELRERGFLP